MSTNLQSEKLRDVGLIVLPIRRVLYYISTMMAFLKNSRTVSDKDALQQRLSGVPSIVLDGLISRFTEKERDTNKCAS